MLNKNEFPEDQGWIDDLALSGIAPAYGTPLGAMFNIDALILLKSLPDDSLDLVLTSPPYALTLKKKYGNVSADEYVGWLMPFVLEINRTLKPTGSFVLDIGGSWVPGSPVRNIYHLAIAVEIHKHMKLAQEFFWYNPAVLPSPAEWVTIQRIRVKSSVDMVYQFSKTARPKASNRKVLQPYSESMMNMFRNGCKNEARPSGHHQTQSFLKDNGGSIASNLLQISNTESNSRYLRHCRAAGVKAHPARFPSDLVKFFVDYLTDEGDLVYDPFAGSNTTGMVCEQSGRRWLASELDSGYVDSSTYRFAE